MKWNSVTWFAFAALSPAIALGDAAALQACTDIYKNATHDFSQVDTSNIELARSFNSFCKSDGSVNTSATGVGLEAVVKSIPFEFSFSSTNNEQKMSEFCKQGASQYDSWKSSNTVSSTVVTAALTNFNSCVQLANSGLQLVPAINQPRMLVVAGSASQGYSGDISSIAYEEDLMTCTSADFDSAHKVQTLHGPVHLSAAKPFSLTCTKKGIVSKDGKSTYYPRTTLTLSATGVSPLAIVFPSEELNGFELASQAQASVAQAVDAYAQANAEANRERQVAVKLQERLDGVTARLVVHSIGSGTPWGCGPSPGGHDWGGDLEREAATACGTAKRVVTSAENHSGGHCGYTVAGYACLVVPPP